MGSPYPIPQGGPGSYIMGFNLSDSAAIYGALVTNVQEGDPYSSVQVVNDSSSYFHLEEFNSGTYGILLCTLTPFFFGIVWVVWKKYLDWRKNKSTKAAEAVLNHFQ